MCDAGEPGVPAGAVVRDGGAPTCAAQAPRAHRPPPTSHRQAHLPPNSNVVERSKPYCSLRLCLGFRSSPGSLGVQFTATHHASFTGHRGTTMNTNYRQSHKYLHSCTVAHPICMISPSIGFWPGFAFLNWLRANGKLVWTFPFFWFPLLWLSMVLHGDYQGYGLLQFTMFDGIIQKTVSKHSFLTPIIACIMKTFVVHVWFATLG